MPELEALREDAVWAIIPADGDRRSDEKCRTAIAVSSVDISRGKCCRFSKLKAMTFAMLFLLAGMAVIGHFAVRLAKASVPVLQQNGWLTNSSETIYPTLDHSINSGLFSGSSSVEHVSKNHGFSSPADTGSVPIFAHPIPVNPNSYPPGFSGHYWVGAYWEGQTTATVVAVTLSTPEHSPISADNYYIILSVWDNAGSYDQIGMASYQGHWGLVWSAAPNCAAKYYYSEDAMNLAINTNYTYSMYSHSNGSIEFAAYQGNSLSSGPLVWSHWFITGGTYFVEQGFYTCGGQSYYDYTNYEEVYTVSQQNYPDWSFFFYGNNQSSGWAAFTAGNTPSGEVAVITLGSGVIVANEWFDVTAGTAFGSGKLAELILTPGSSGSITADIRELFTPTGGAGTVSLSLIDLPSGWGSSFTPVSGTPSFSSTITVKVPSGASTGLYTIGLNASGPGGVFTSAQFLVDVYVSSGGGGCVAWGTMILTPEGYVPVQKLDTGQVILEYNFTSGTLQSYAVLGNNKTRVSEVADINNGMILVTPTDQPIYIRNSTFTGWLRNPQNLTNEDQIFDPVNNSWVNVTSVTILKTNILVFDLVTSGWNNFIANSFLLDKKAP